MGVPRPFPALTSMILRFRKYTEASKIKCNKAVNHSFKEKPYYYLFFSCYILVELSWTGYFVSSSETLSIPGSTVLDTIMTTILTWVGGGTEQSHGSTAPQAASPTLFPLFVRISAEQWVWEREWIGMIGDGLTFKNTNTYQNFYATHRAD